MIYTAVTGQSLYDICIITYGSLDFLIKLANDNNIADLNNSALTGIAFTYDSTLIVNQVINQSLQQSINQQYGTGQIYNEENNTGGRYHDDFFDIIHD